MPQLHRKKKNRGLQGLDLLLGASFHVATQSWDHAGLLTSFPFWQLIQSLASRLGYAAKEAMRREPSGKSGCGDFLMVFLRVTTWCGRSSTSMEPFKIGVFIS